MDELTLCFHRQITELENRAAGGTVGTHQTTVTKGAERPHLLITTFFDTYRQNLIYAAPVAHIDCETLEYALHAILSVRIDEWSSDPEYRDMMEGFGVFMVYGSQKPDPGITRIVRAYGLEYVQVYAR